MCSVVWTTQECQSEWREEAKQRRQHPKGCCRWVGFGSGSREGGEDRPKNTGARRFLVKRDFKEYEKGCEGRVWTRLFLTEWKSLTLTFLWNRGSNLGHTKVHPSFWGFFTLVMARKISANSYGHNKGFHTSIHLIRTPSVMMHGEKLRPNFNSVLILIEDIPEWGDSVSPWGINNQG